ncbi:GpE family phage tail protein [Salinisphaera orenii]|uniref:P2 GpE family protein n=1 Tax=Salinisphaera orenii YIM 95161 TaxID=1051139 RepID=A0A423PRM2_9GAMM|nr:GpE family phage tail protein [Salinisphaera halophila]ROO28244.1 P2 GpE family protein [Salinisphaera halophila YIM 95161]
MIAYVFHWPPDWLMDRPFSELMDWRDRARAIHQEAHAAPEED